MRAAEADLPPIPLWGSPALLFTCSPALCRFQPAVSPARKSLTGSGTSLTPRFCRRTTHPAEKPPGTFNAFWGH